MGFSKKGSTSYAMALARIAVGIMFLFFAQYKLFSSEFAHGGYAKYVSSYANETAVVYYRPFLHLTLRHPVASGYSVAIPEGLIGLSILLVLSLLPFSL